MSKYTSFLGHAIAALTGPAQASAQHALIALSVFGIVGGTTVQMLTTGAQTSDPMCLDHCNTMTGTEEEKTMCRNGCSGAYSSPSGTYSSPSGTYSSPSGTYSSPSGTYSSPSGTYSSPSGGTYSSYPSGGTSGNYSPSYWSQSKQKTFPLTSVSDCDGLVSRGEIPASELDWCKMAIGGSTSGMPGGTSGGGGTSGVAICQYPSAQIIINGQQVGRTLSCTGEGQNCHEGSQSGPSVAREVISSLGVPTGCMPEGSGAGQSSSMPSGIPICGPNQFPPACRFDTQWGSPGGMPGGMHPCGPNESPMSGTCYAPGGTTATGRMCDFYPDGYQTPCPTGVACAMRYTRPMEQRLCDSTECTTNWNRNEPGKPSCVSPGSYPTSGGQSGGNYQGGSQPDEYMIQEFMRKYGITRDEAIAKIRGFGGQSGGYYQGGSQGGYMGNTGGNWGQSGGFPPYGDYNGGMHGAGDQWMGDQMKQQMVQEMVQRMAVELFRNCDHFSTMFGPPGSAPKIKELGSQCRKDMEALAANASPENMGSLQSAAMQKMEEYRAKLDEVFYASQATSMKGDAERYIREMEFGAKSASKIIEMVAKKNPAVADQMKTVQAKTLAAVEQAKAALSAGQFQQVFGILDAVQQEMMQREMQWRDVMGDLGMGFGPDNRDVYHDFVEEHGYDDGMKEYFQKQGFDRGDMSRMDTLRGFYEGDDTFDNYLEFQSEEGEGNDLLTVADDLSLTEVNTLINLKMSLLAEIENAKAQLSSLKASAKAIVSEIMESIRQFNFADSSIGDKAMVLVEAAARGENVDAAKTEYQKIVAESIQQEYLKGISNFSDVSILNPEWFAEYATGGWEEGIFTGNPDGTLGPANNVTSVEALVMLARALEIQPLEGEVSSLTAYPMWAQETLAAQEEADVDMSAVDLTNPAAVVTRAQFAELAKNLIPEELMGTQTPVAFTDISSLPVETQRTINALAGLGVIDADGTFNPEDPMNKAGLAKVLLLGKHTATDYLTTQEYSDYSGEEHQSEEDFSEEEFVQ